MDAFEVAKTIRERCNIPLVPLTYYNLVFKIGLLRFLKLGRKTGISGLIIPDLPIEESRNYRKECASNEVDTISLAAPSTDEARLKRIAAETFGYLYLISLYGVTSARSMLAEDALQLIKRYDNFLRNNLPSAVGLGISGADQIKRMVHAGADGVIVGKRFR